MSSAKENAQMKKEKMNILAWVHKHTKAFYISVLKFYAVHSIKLKKFTDKKMKISSHLLYLLPLAMGIGIAMSIQTAINSQ